ncbi:MAG TPA: hypothetical protein DCZ11_04470, partial [Gammaproteobacteria bacterium]|nr:hypothetical protein [Gammaproteobacteria bacterium]MCH77680.1 hypothetical protein [Gammaproteobacteria bacterium]
MSDLLLTEPQRRVLDYVRAPPSRIALREVLIPVGEVEDCDDAAPPPRREGPRPVTTVAELCDLDSELAAAGYRAAFTGDPDYSQRDRAYWHGYLNGLVDTGRAQPSPEQLALAREVGQRRTWA